MEMITATTVSKMPFDGICIPLSIRPAFSAFFAAIEKLFTSNKQQATSNKQQATSNKLQATSYKLQATSVVLICRNKAFPVQFDWLSVFQNIGELCLEKIYQYYFIAAEPHYGRMRLFFVLPLSDWRNN